MSVCILFPSCSVELILELYTYNLVCIKNLINNSLELVQTNDYCCYYSQFVSFIELGLSQAGSTNTCYFMDTNATSPCVLNNSCLYIKSCQKDFSESEPDYQQSEHTHCYLYYLLNGLNEAPTPLSRGGLGW